MPSNTSALMPRCSSCDLRCLLCCSYAAVLKNVRNSSMYGFFSLTARLAAGQNLQGTIKPSQCPKDPKRYHDLLGGMAFWNTSFNRNQACERDFYRSPTAPSSAKGASTGGLLGAAAARETAGSAHGTQAPDPQPYHGFSSSSTRRPSRSLLNPQNRSTTAISSRTPSSLRPNFCTAEVWTCSQYSQLLVAETATAMISLVRRSSSPGSTITAFTLFQFASR